MLPSTTQAVSISQGTFSLWKTQYVAMVTCLFLFMGFNIHLAKAISCYECDSSSNFTCTEKWDPSSRTSSIYRNNCRKVFEATYCIKMTGIYDGKLGTKRFCSSKDWGNYCEYIKRPGDIQEYRSCVFSCSISGCNSAPNTVNVTSHWTPTCFALMSVIMSVFI